MARASRKSRRRPVDSDSSDGESSNQKLGVKIDPKIALQIADLGNTARDRQTAHDLEADRKVNFAQINFTRKCNQQGSDEAKKAAANQKQISSWNNLGGDDSTTTLDDIGRGQYHRVATSQKVQAEVRQLRIAGKDINAESVDEPQGRRNVRGTAASHKGTQGRSQGLPMLNHGARSLDPAVDPNRVYDYKNGPKYGSRQNQPVRGLSASRGGRGSSGSGRGGHSTQVGRGALINVHTPPNGTPFSPAESASTPAAARNNVTAKPVRGRRIQERPWPPAALVGNLTPSSSSLMALYGPATASVSNESPAVSEEAVNENASQAPNTARSDTVETQIAAATVAPDLKHPLSSAPKVKHNVLIANQTQLAEDFSQWFQVAGSSDSVSTAYKPPAPPPTSVPLAAPALPQIQEEDLLMISRDEIITTEGILKPQDHYTDGRLTPVEFSDGSDDDEVIIHPPKPPSPLQVKSNNVAVRNDIGKSKWAPGNMTKPPQPRTESVGIKRTAAGPGFELLVRELASKQISLNNNRRPDQPAFTQAPRGNPFSQYPFNQYREPATFHESTSEDEL